MFSLRKAVWEQLSAHTDSLWVMVTYIVGRSYSLMTTKTSLPSKDEMQLATFADTVSYYITKI